MAKRAAIVVGMVAALAACAERKPGWVHPQLPPAQASADLTECRRWADDRVDPDRSAEATLSGGSPFTPEERARLRRQLNALVAACMQDKGYRPARP